MIDLSKLINIIKNSKINKYVSLDMGIQGNFSKKSTTIRIYEKSKVKNIIKLKEIIKEYEEQYLST